ncbi:MAG: UDP-glucose 4-epimerase family protein [Pseudomonadota bacterium]
MADRVLVTGGSGFVGSAVLRVLHARGGRAVVAALRTAYAQVPVGIRVETVAGLDADTDWSRCVEGVDAVIHCAARVHVLDDAVADPLAEYRRVNVDGTLALARAAAQAGVRRFVFVSSIKVNGEHTAPGQPFRADDAPAPDDAYGISKWEAEQGLFALARETGMEVVVVRPPLVYGPGAKGNFAAMMRWVARGVPLPLGAVRHNRRSLVGLDNLVDLIVTCLDHPGAANEVFLAADGEDLSTADLLQRVARAMGRPARLLPVPVWALRAAAASLGKRAMAQRLLGSLQVDGSKARELLGWEPPCRVDEGLKRSVATMGVGGQPAGRSTGGAGARRPS